MTGILTTFVLLALCAPYSSHADPINRNGIVKRSLKSASLIASNTNSKDHAHSKHGKLRLRFASKEEQDNGIHGNAINDTDEDYDFVLDLNEHDDFDRLLNILSRSGPAKHDDKHKNGKASTYLDRHDEMAKDDSEALLLSSYKGKGFPSKAHQIRPEEEGSNFDDLQKEKEEQEQRRLEALYFEEIHDQRKEQQEEENRRKKMRNQQKNKNNGKGAAGHISASMTLIVGACVTAVSLMA